MKKIAYLVSHPIQYQAPMLKYIASNSDVDLEVLFQTDMSVTGYKDEEFNKKIYWDIPLLEGYKFKFLKTFSWDRNKLSFFSPICLSIYSVIKNGNYDCIWIHGWGSFTNIMAILVAKKLNIKILMRGENGIHIPKRSHPLNFFKRKILLHLFKKIDFFLAIGTFNAKFYESYGIDRSKIIWMPYAVDNAFFQKWSSHYNSLVRIEKTKLGIDNEANIILYASKLTRRKNPLDLLLAYKNLIKTTPNDHPYLLFVGSGEMELELKRIVKIYNLDRVRFLGFMNQNELPKYYELCDVFVLPSSTEQWGLVINEVMNHSKPVIVSDEVGCGPDLIENNVNGFIFKCGDVSQLEICLSKLLANDIKKNQMSASSYQKINQWSFKQDLEALYSVINIL